MDAAAPHDASDLGEREQEILTILVDEYIRKSEAIPSKTIANKKEVDLSPASVRKYLAQLEKRGYIVQPHTSAGRIPTDKGYRFFINHLMGRLRIEKSAADNIKKSLEFLTSDMDSIVVDVSRLLGHLSHEIGIALSRHFEGGVLRKIRIVSQSSRIFLLILTIDPGIVKTSWLETKDEIGLKEVENLNPFLNERLSGVRLEEIRKTFRDRVRDSIYSQSLLIMTIGDNRRNLFRVSARSRLHLFGTSHVLRYPEFNLPEKYLPLLRVLDERNDLLELLESQSGNEHLTIYVGREIPLEEIQDCSLITSGYGSENVSGVIGILGPMRMRYSRLIPIVEYTAHQITENLHFDVS